MQLEVYKKSDFYEDYISSQKEYYERENADAYFAEKLAEKDNEIALLKKRICNGDVSRATWIDDCFDKDKEIAELKAKLENMQAENAELKAKVDELSFDKKLLEGHWESEKIRCEAVSRDCIELSNENAKLVSKIESLKVGHRQGIANLKSYYKAKLENVQASMYCDVVDANMENRRLRRALYKACANWAHATIYYSGVHESDEFKWENMETECLKKAEEYK